MLKWATVVKWHVAGAGGLCHACCSLGGLQVQVGPGYDDGQDVELAWLIHMPEFQEIRC